MMLLGQIDEDDEEYYSEIFIDDLESGDAGSILDEAIDLHKRYKELKFMPSSEGYVLYRKGTGLMTKSSKKFLQLIQTQGVLIKYDS